MFACSCVCVGDTWICGESWLAHRPKAGYPSYICLFVWAMVGWVTSPFFLISASVLYTCIFMYL